MKFQLKSLFICTCAALLLTACSGGKSKQEKLKQSERKEFIKTLPKSKTIQVKWNRNLGDFNELGFHFVIDQSVIYTIDADGRLSAVNLDDGELVWAKKTGHDIITGIGVGDQGLFAVDSDANLLAFDRNNGDLLWRSAILSEVMTPPIVSGSNVVVKTADARLIGYDVNTGNESWVYRHTKPGLTLRGSSRPITVSNLLITGFEDGRLVAVNTITGHSLWSIPVGRSSGRDEISRLTDIDAQPLLIDNDLYVGSFQRRIIALDIELGRVSWGRNISTYQNFAVDAEKLYLIDDKANVLALNRANGSLLWAQESLAGAPLQSLTLLDDNLLISSGEGTMFVLKISDGYVISKQEVPGGRLLGQPQVRDNTAYMLTENGDIKAVTLAN